MRLVMECPELVATAFAIVSVFAPGAAPAQERPGSVYIIGGIAFPRQTGPTAEVPVTYVTAPGGTTLGWLFGGGVSIAKHLSIDGEFSSTGLMTATEPSRYGMTFNEERRDRFLSFAARLSFPASGLLRVEPILGLVFTYSRASSQVDSYVYWMTPQQMLVHQPELEHHLDVGIGPTFGCDVRIGNRRVAIVPSFRVSRSRVSKGRYGDSSYESEIESIYPGGYPTWTVRPGVAVRMDF